MRHQREVHAQESKRKPVQTYRCPELSCKRHHKTFARLANLTAHYRRIHQDSHNSDSQDSSFMIQDSGGDLASDKDSTINVPDASEELETLHSKDIVVSGKDTTLEFLRAELRKLQEQKSEAMLRYDENIAALGRALGVVEERTLGAIMA